MYMLLLLVFESLSLSLSVALGVRASLKECSLHVIMAKQKANKNRISLHSYLHCLLAFPISKSEHAYANISLVAFLFSLDTLSWLFFGQLRVVASNT